MYKSKEIIIKDYKEWITKDAGYSVNDRCYCDENQGYGYTYNDEYGDCSYCEEEEVGDMKALYIFLVTGERNNGQSLIQTVAATHEKYVKQIIDKGLFVGKLKIVELGIAHAYTKSEDLDNLGFVYPQDTSL